MTTDSAVTDAQIEKQDAGNQPAPVGADGHPVITVHPSDYYSNVTKTTDTGSEGTVNGSDTTPTTVVPQTSSSATVAPPTLPWKDLAPVISQGANRQQVAQQIAQQNNISPDDADSQVIDSVESQIKAAQQAGNSDDAIKQNLVDNKVDPSIIDGAFSLNKTNHKPPTYNPNDPATKPVNPNDISSVYNEVNDTVKQSPEMIAAEYNEVNSPQATILKDQVMGLAGNEQDSQQASNMIAKLNQGLVAKLNQDGYKAHQDPKTGEAMVMKNGVVTPVDAGLVKSIYASSNETLGSIGGAVAGGIAGGAVGSVVPVVGTAIGAAAGSFAGGAMGAAAGKAADMAINSSILKENLSAQNYYNQMKQAAIYDGVASVVGGAIAKGVGAVAVTGWKYYVRGNQAGALRALVKDAHISVDQAHAIVNNWEDLHGRVLQKRNVYGKVKDLYDHFTKEPQVPQELSRAKGKTSSYFSGNSDLTPNQKIIAIVPTTTPRMNSIVHEVSSTNPTIGTSMVRDISSRAKAVNKASAELGGRDAYVELERGIEESEKDVKGFYTHVKNIGVDHVNGTDYRFDVNKLGIIPTLRRIAGKDGAGLYDPSLKERFVRLLERTTSKNANRQFSDLMDLKNEVNAFIHTGSKNIKFDDLKALIGVKVKINNEIRNTAKKYIPKGLEWDNLYTKANKEYSNMLKLRENRLVRLIINPNTKEQSLQSALNSYSHEGNADLINPVLNRLPPAARAKVEGAVIDNLVKKYTSGTTSLDQSTDFVYLSDALKQMNIQTPRAKALVDRIEDFAKVQKTDPNLFGITGHITVQSPGAGGIGKSIVGKMEVQIATKVFQGIQRLIPMGNVTNQRALIHNMSKLLRTPLHASTVDDFMKLVPAEDKAEVNTLVKNLQKQVAQNPNPVFKTVNMYQQSNSGSLRTSNGRLGKGIYVSNKITNPNPTIKTIAHPVETSRIANVQHVRDIVGDQTIQEGDIKDHPRAIQTLIDRGKLGIQDSKGTMLFPDMTLGVKSTAGKKFVKTNTPTYTEQTVKAARQHREENMTPSQIKEREATLATETPAQKRTRETLEAARNNQKPKF